MKQKLTCILLALVLLTGLLPLTAEAAQGAADVLPCNTQLTQVTVAAVKEPVAGGQAVYYADAATQGYYVNYEYNNANIHYINGVRWMDMTTGYPEYFDGTFQAGRTYRVEVMLRTDTGFDFAGNGSGVIATVNGKPATLSTAPGDNTSYSIVVCYTFPKLPETGDNIIDFVDVAVTYPVVGKKLDYSIQLEPAADYYVQDYTGTNYQHGVAWVLVETGNTLPANTVYQENVAYAVYILLLANDGKVFSPNTEAIINGQAATAELIEDTLIIYRTFYPNPANPDDNPFTDVTLTDYFYDPVLWAYNHNPQITNGTSETKFSPNATCTRAQVVTFLWRAMGCPEPTLTSCPFKDVAANQYYYKAVLWAVENDITTGTSETTFSPDKGCTRAQVVTFLWRAEKMPGVQSWQTPFLDLDTSQYYYEAVIWAVENGITKGTGDTTFSPNKTCTRGQIVTFLYRDLSNP